MPGPEYEPLLCDKCGAVAAYLDYVIWTLDIVPALCVACYDQQQRMGQ